MLKELIQVLAIVLFCNMPLIAMEDDRENPLVRFNIQEPSDPEKLKLYK